MCEFCGTVKENTVAVADGSLVDILFEKDGYQYHFKGLVDSWELASECYHTDLYSDNGYFTTFVDPAPSFYLTAGMKVVTNENGSAFSVRKISKEADRV